MKHYELPYNAQLSFKRGSDLEPTLPYRYHDRPYYNVLLQTRASQE